MTHIRIATRRSPLALWQAEFVASELERHFPEVSTELVKIKTRGDKILDVPLAKVGGKGLFTKEIDEALVDGRADIAVHSMKDVPTELPEGMEIRAVPERGDPRDAVATRTGGKLETLPAGAIVGTSSLRRLCQMKALYPNLKFTSIRGSVQTRLSKLENEVDAVVLAAAGVRRLGIEDRMHEFLDPDVMLPAVAQGTLGIQTRIGDETINPLIDVLNHTDTVDRTRAERAFLARLEGGCQVPIGAYAVLEGDELHLTGLVGAVDGSVMIRRECRGSRQDGAEMGRKLAEEVLDAGARPILDELYAQEQ